MVTQEEAMRSAIAVILPRGIFRLVPTNKMEQIHRDGMLVLLRTLTMSTYNLHLYPPPCPRGGVE